MKPGPRPDPLETRRAKGNPQRRPLPADAPGPLPGALTCPRHLTGLARETWHQAAAKVAELGLMLAAAGTGTPYVNPWVYLARGGRRALEA